LFGGESVYLYDLFSPTELQKRVDEHWVTKRDHPTLPLAILNYSDKTQYHWSWDDVTRKTRGLIYNTETLEVVARPFDKFFNLHELKQDEIRLLKIGKVRVTDKVDGSLGILYPTGDGYAIASRGSFNSDQAIRGTEILHRKYPGYKLPRNYTAIFEIVYPENRIVLDYKDMEDLVLLGFRHIPTGITSGPEMGITWQGPKAETFHYDSFDDAVSAPPRPNAEGIVIHHEVSDVRVKVKQDDYVKAHRMVFGLDERAVWEWLSEHEDIRGLVEYLPDEFYHWAAEVEDRLHRSRSHLFYQAVETAMLFVTPEGVDERGRRKAFAQSIAHRPKDVKAVAFALYGGDMERARDTAWKAIRPAKGKTAVKGLANA
jgi:RNA ligase